MDCAGHVLEVTNCDQNAFCSQFGALTEAEFKSLKFNAVWQCGQEQKIISSVQESEPPFIQEKPEMILLSCSPNPATTWIACGTNFTMEPLAIQITDIIGRHYSVPYQIQDQQINIDIHHLPPGLYVLSIQGKNDFYIAKVLVQ